MRYVILSIKRLLYCIVLLPHLALWKTRSKDKLACQDSPAVFNQVGLYLVGLLLRVELCFLLDEVEPKRKDLSTFLYRAYMYRYSYENSDRSVAELQFSLQSGVTAVSY